MISFLSIVIVIISFTQSNLAQSDDIRRNATQLITSRGFEAETHSVTTTDGYILTMFRIINPYWKDPVKSSVLLQHGVLGNCDYWMQNTPGILDTSGGYTEESGVVTDCSAVNASAVGNTIPFVLSACGYDVWLGNNRGTLYSDKHVEYNSEDQDYWKYSIDELENDIIAEVNYIRNETESETICYIGHSLGTTQMFQLLTENTELNKVIKPFIALAPVAYLGHVKTLARTAAIIQPVFQQLNGPLFILPPEHLKLLDLALGYLCSVPVVSGLCETFLFTYGGVNFQDNKSKYFGARIAHTPDETSIMVASQIAYRVNTDTLSKYDYLDQNQAIYGQPTPPAYNLSAITSPNIVLMSGLNDYLADPTDVQHLRDELTVELVEDYTVPEYEHFDFIWADNTGTTVVPKILALLDSME